MALVKAEEVKGSWQGLNRLSLVRQLGLLLGLAASIAVGVGVWSWAQRPGYRVLFSGLEEPDAARVVEALQQNDIPYRLDAGSGAILVPGAKLHAARLQLAAQGLPQGTGHGFELLGKDSGFGVSQFMETARYQRALEVELARTIATLAAVKAARVHLALPPRTAFIRRKEKPRASVALNLYAGRSLEEGQVEAIAHLVASSVPELDVGQVTVVDQRGRLLTAKRSDRLLALTRSQFDYTRKLEQSFVERVEAILEPILGPGAVRAQVTADIDFTTTEQTQELYDPDSAALRSSQRVEERSGEPEAAGIPGALSNQPPGPGQVPEVATGQAAEGTGGTPAGKLRRREVKNFELDRTIAHTRFAPGRLRRLSVAVVVDDKVSTGPDGQVVRTPRSPEEIHRITELVKEAVGYSAQRGDRVNVVNASFAPLPEPEPLPEPAFWEDPAVQDLGKQLLAAGLLAFLLLGVLRPVMKSLAKAAPATAMVPAPAGQGAGEGLAEDRVSLQGPAAPAQLTGPRPDSYEAHMEKATEVVRQDPKLAAQVVKTWVAADE